MALDRRKKLKSAEQLLKQGKVQAALVELEDLANSAPRDLLTLNRLGDMLAKQGRRREAIRFYERIATQFTQSGFLPKAIAIHKKILRLQPDFVGSLRQLGELYRLQKLPGEARSYLLRAAEQHLKARDFVQAREVYESLVAAEPADPRHRARLAEARAAEGETTKAGEELVALADSLLAAGQAHDAERAYRRAAELLTPRAEPQLGIVRSLAAQGRADEALAALDALPDGAEPGEATVLGERLLLYEHMGRSADSVELLQQPAAPEIADVVFVEIFRRALDNGGVEALWQRLEPVFARWREAAGDERVALLYARLAEIEPQGHLPALERLVALREEGGEGATLAEAMQRLLRAYRSRSMDEAAEALAERLHDHVPAAAPEVESASDAVETPPPPPVVEPAPAEPAGGEPPIEAEAPAVPLSHGDEEFVTGRLTQAEILEKYGLLDQALQQIREVTAKFPGHVASQQKLVDFLREGADRAALRDAMVALALAQRASGDGEAALRTVAEAQGAAALEEGTRATLQTLGLLTDATSEEVATPTEPVEPETIDTPAEAPVAAADEPVVTIDFDALDETQPEIEVEPEVEPVIEPAPPEEIGVAGLDAPGRDVFAEIRALLERDQVQEAARRVEALRTLGFSGDELDRLQAEVGARQTDVPAVTPPEPVAPAEGEDDDLSAITAALESELFEEEAPAAAQPEAEQSLEDVFAAFKAHVAEEVGQEDYRTHYDLGIAYKEMGLTEEAIQQFRRAADSPELDRDSYAMLAVCHREREELEAAENCYLHAIERSNGDVATLSSLRYELAEVLLQRGDRQGALTQFRNLLDADPSFRDVRDRIAKLETHAR